MKNLVDFLEDIYEQGWQLWIENQQLCYEAPKTTSTDSILAKIKQHKNEILQLLPGSQNQLLENFARENNRSQSVFVPLTEAQKQLWFLDQLEGNSKQAYIDYVYFQLKGELQIDAMQRAIQSIVERHEALRTKICPEGDLQEVLSGFKVQLPLIDFSNSSASERESQVSQWLEEKIQEPFNLNQAPLFQVYILKLEEKLHQLIIKIHHIIYDGFSMGIILEEISTLYEAYCLGRIPKLEPPMQFREYIKLQNQKSQTQKTLVDESYWLEKFSSSIPTLDLPTDKTRPSIMSYRGGRQTLSLDTKLCTQIKRVGQQFRCTLFMTLLAAYNILLYKLTGDEDVVVGIPTAARNFEGSDNLVGYCTHLLPIRTKLFYNTYDDDNSLKFVDFLTQMRGGLLDDYEHKDYPFSQLLNKLNLKRDSSRPLFISTLFNLNPSQTLKLLGLETSLISIPKNFLAYDLYLDITESENELLLNLYYNTDLFDDTTIKRWLGHFQNLLSAVVENPYLYISELSLLSKSEHHKLLVDWNDTATNYPQDKCIHQLFEEQVEKSPDAIAIIFEDKQLTYQQLNQKANQLAHHLQTLGIKPEVKVGICVERSIDMVVGLLGILKAGGAYVPLDPNYPQERLSYMLEDSGVEVLLTQNSLQSSLPLHTLRGVLCLDTDWKEIEQHSPENLEVGVDSGNLAYVIYTSGSTGKPKGVLIEHRGLTNFLISMKNQPGLSQTDKLVAVTTISFDIAALELYLPLTVGAEVILASKEVASNPQQLWATIINNQVTVMQATPATWRMLLSIGWQYQQPLKILCGGEALPKELAQELLAKGSSLWNVYGPTETTIWSTVKKIEPQDDINIGRPLANTQTYILDKHLQPLPIGVPGELYIGGDGLARGYLHRNDLTKERFIVRKFHGSCQTQHKQSQPVEFLIHKETPNEQGERIYKTGDLAKYLPDGSIELLGRIDNQVKVRGFRIELGEIEAVINNHPQIKQAAIVAREDIPGYKRLVAYVVLDDLITTHQVREFTKQKLPDYMVPSAFVILETLPLTPNGKIDRKALPAPDKEIIREHDYVSPRTHIEQTLTNIWQELLIKEKISIHDNFFEIGGDSILCIQVVSRAKSSGIQISTKQIFQNQTIAELATVANTIVTAECQQGLVTGVAPLTPIQHWFKQQHTLEANHYNQSVLLQIPPTIKPNLLQKAVEKLLEHHDALRLRFSSSSKHPQKNHGLDDTVPFTVIDLSSTPTQKQPQAIEEIATKYQASLNLSSGPIMQVVMFNLGYVVDARLLIIIHHLAVDGVSWRILLSDLETIYQKLITQQPIQLSPKTTAFIDWAEKLNSNTCITQTIKQEFDYWVNQPWSKTTSLPVDYAYTPQSNTVASGALLLVKLSQKETRILLESVNEAYNTQINDILLSALVICLAQWTDNSTILIDLEGHGREELFDSVDLSRTVGWFTSLFPVLLQISDDDCLESIIKSVKEQLRAIPNRGIGYGILRYLCTDDTLVQKLKTIPTPEISFNYLGQFDQIESQTGWKFASESTGANHSSKMVREHLLDINALVVEGELQINWSYSSSIHNYSTVEKLAQSYLQAIKSIVEHCQRQENRGYTPSDFPDAQLNQLELDKLLAAINNKNLENIYPLSPMQEGMLFHSLYAPESSVYFGQMNMDLTGNFNIDAFEIAWQKVINRHSVIRTLFVWENLQKPLQVGLNSVQFSSDNLDWRELDSTEQQQQLKQLLQTQKEQGFRLNQAPLMNVTIIRLGEENYKFIWNYHHILMDGWCLPIILKEVFSIYEAQLLGITCELPTPRNYEDYIAWLNSQEKQTAIEFWRETLLDFTAPTPLVIDKTLSHQQQQHTTADYQEITSSFSVKCTQQLQSIAQQNRVTLSTIVQAAWALLLSRYSGEQDVVFGVTVSGRPPSLSGIENMVGLFINTLPLRLQVPTQEQFIVWLQQIQQSMLELQQYSYTPLIDIQANSSVGGGIPLFESIVVFENYPVDSSLLNQQYSLQLNNIESFEITNYPLTVIALPGDELSINIIYDAARFEKDTIERMLGHLQTILSAIVENPQVHVSKIPLLTNYERIKLLHSSNNITTYYQLHKYVHSYSNNLQVYILDKYQQLVPVGVEGEIYLEYTNLSPENLDSNVTVIEHPQLGKLLKTGEWGRRQGDAHLELLGKAHRIVTVKEQRINLQHIEQALLTLVEDCYVMVRNQKLVVYIVKQGNFSPKFLNNHLKSQLSVYPLPYAYVPVSALPLTALGQVDEAVLVKLEVIDNDLINRWEEQLRSHSQIEQVAVVKQPKQTKASRPIHLLDVIPQGTPKNYYPIKTETPEVVKITSPSKHITSFIPAFSDGGALIIPENVPLTLTEALIKTATQYPQKEIIYVLADKQISQTYSDLLAQAKCILNGLRDRGLKAGEKVILQISSLQDYFPALWGCILGGIQPVTVAVAKTYQQVNAVVKKLYNTWELLEYPPILASESLVEPLQNLEQLLPFSEMEILPVEQMRNYPATEEIYHAQPSDVAFLQLTSGSTGVPKCIQETHQGIVAHIHAVQQFNGYQREDVCLNWLPVDHVVPILTCHFKDTYLGCQQIEVTTDAVLATPTLWLDLMEKYQVTHSWSPNFGFKLVSDALLKAPNLNYDLSSVKFLMNAGEQVTGKVVREFLKLLADTGISAQAMQPAFGMAEVCTCMTYQNQFDCQSGIHRIKKSSLGGQLLKTEATDTDVIEFIDLGATVPGVQIRIADGDNQILPEGVIGRLQIKGKVVTPGYLNNQQANLEAFVGDGWFNSGDLGFIIDGKLVLTGREKELIIINGANYYCYEIEDIVNAIEGVEPTYVGAISFSQTETGTEGLVILFTPKQPQLELNIELIKTIGKEVSSQLGIAPTYVIPISKTEFPKTTSGKIQRSKLKKMLESGDFQETIKAIDIHLENNQTIPNWFYRKIWQKKENINSSIPDYTDNKLTLIFAYNLGLATKLNQELSQQHLPYIQVNIGSDFAKINPNHYSLVPGNPQHYRLLIDSLVENNQVVGQILHLWDYQEQTEEISSLEILESNQQQGVYSLLSLVQALEEIQGTQETVKLLWIANNSQSVNPTDKIEPQKATVFGLLKTVTQEKPWLTTRHLDLPFAAELNSSYIWQELYSAENELEVAIRNGERFVSRLESVDMIDCEKQEIPIKPEGTYLLTGGLGGIGTVIAKYLLENYQANLILVGRSNLSEQNENNTTKIKQYQELEKLPGSVIYQAVDICDKLGLQQVVEKATKQWGTQLDGVLHMAGITQEKPIDEETPSSIAAVLRPKLSGTWVLHQLLKDKENALFVHFSSVNGFFGGANVAAYSAANSFQSAWSDYQQQNGFKSYCFSWSMWNQTGMSKNYQFQELSRAKGYFTITPQQGINSFLAALSQHENNLLIGLDGTKTNVEHLIRDCQPKQKLTAYFTSSTQDAALSLQKLQLHDCFGVPNQVDFVQLEQIPLTETGEINRKQIAAIYGGLSTGEQTKPQNETEQKLVNIFQEVLNVASVGIHDNFFALGGHSLLAIRLISQIQQQFQKNLPLATLFRSPSVEQLAPLVEFDSGTELWSSLVPIQKNGSLPPLFCVPGVGGNVLYFHNLAKYLGNNQPFYGLQAQGLDGETKPLGSIEEIASQYIKAIIQVQPHGPYFLAGHSFGAHVVFEMASQLQTLGQSVAFVGILDIGAPTSEFNHYEDDYSNWDNAQWICKIAELVEELMRKNILLSKETLASLAPEQQLNYFKEQLELVGFLPPQTNIKLVRGLLQVFQTQAQIDYNPQNTSLVPITLFRTKELKGEQENYSQLLQEPAWGWNHFSDKEVEIHTVPGSHISIMREPYVNVLAEKLQKSLEKAYVQTIPPEVTIQGL